MSLSGKTAKTCVFSFIGMVLAGKIFGILDLDLSAAIFFVVVSVILYIAALIIQKLN